MLRAVKNRFGPTQEPALFTMGDHGLEEVPNASAALLADRRTGASGSAVAVAMEGATPLLVEVQASAARSPLVTPAAWRREWTRAAWPCCSAVLEKRQPAGRRPRRLRQPGRGRDRGGAGAGRGGGSGGDLRGRRHPHPGRPRLFGEVGLLGEIRTVAHAAERLREAEALGFGRCAAPAGTQAPRSGIVLQPLATVGDIVGLVCAIPPRGCTDASANEAAIPGELLNDVETLRRSLRLYPETHPALQPAREPPAARRNPRRRGAAATIGVGPDRFFWNMEEVTAPPSAPAP